MEEIAAFLEFESSNEMLKHWYVEENRSIEQISSSIDVPVSLLQKELVKRKIVSFGRGIRPGRFTCRHCGGEFNGDVRNVCCTNPVCQDKEDEMIRQTKYLITQRRINRKTNNSCMICGKDKGANRFYCRKCHSLVSLGALFD